MGARTTLIAGAAAAAFVAVPSSQGRGNPNEWPTAYGDAQHSSWIRSDVNISIESMSQPGFGLQWKTSLESPARQGVSLTSGVVTSGVNIFTPISTVAGTENRIFTLDNDTGNVFWTRRIDGALAPSSAQCTGGISGAPTRTVPFVAPSSAPARGGAGRGGRAYGGAVGEPGAGVPIAPPAGGGRAGPGGAGRGQAGAPPPPPSAPTQRGQGAPAAGPTTPAAPFPTNPAAVAAAGGPGGGLFRASGTISVVTEDGMFRTLGLVSGKDIQRPARFVPAGARFSDLIAVDDRVYTATSQGCGGAPNGIWAIHTSGDPSSVTSWKTNGGAPIGSVVFSRGGTLIAAIGPGSVTAGGYANTIVALDPKSLELKEWFRQPGIEFVAAPTAFQLGSREVVAVTTRDGRVVLLDAASLGGIDHATPLFVSSPLVTGRATLTAQSPATWEERTGAAAAGVGATEAASSGDGTRWLLLSAAGALTPPSGVTTNGPITTGGILAVTISHEAGVFGVQPGWVSENIAAPLTPIVINGVVFAASGAPSESAKLYALNGTTGKVLWQSGGEMTAAISGRSLWAGSGHVFVGTSDGTVYSFGFDMERGTPDQRATWR